MERIAGAYTFTKMVILVIDARLAIKHNAKVSVRVCIEILLILKDNRTHAPLAQLVRAFASHAKGHTFESYRVHSRHEICPAAD